MDKKKHKQPHLTAFQQTQIWGVSTHPKHTNSEAPPCSPSRWLPLFLNETETERGRCYTVLWRWGTFWGNSNTRIFLSTIPRMEKQTRTSLVRGPGVKRVADGRVWGCGRMECRPVPPSYHTLIYPGGGVTFERPPKRDRAGDDQREPKRPQSSKFGTLLPTSWKTIWKNIRKLQNIIRKIYVYICICIYVLVYIFM